MLLRIINPCTHSRRNRIKYRQNKPSITLHFGIHIRSHILGTENIVADALSRVDTIVMPTSLDMQEIAEAQASDDKLQQLKQSTSLKLKKFTLSEIACNIYCDTSEEEIRSYIPRSLRRQVFDIKYLIQAAEQPIGKLR